MVLTGGVVLVQSSMAEPDWTHLPEDYCALVRGPKPIAPGLARGELYAFRLHANPTVKRQGKRFGLVHEEEQIAWLRRKGERGGFTLLHAVTASHQLGDRWSGAPSHEHKTSIPHLAVRFDGVVMTKLDGDARGGAALSVRAVTGQPILFVSTGEHLEQFERFHPDRMAQRILGMGDVMSLIEQAERQFDEHEAVELQRKLRRNPESFHTEWMELTLTDNLGRTIVVTSRTITTWPSYGFWPNQMVLCNSSEIECEGRRAYGEIFDIYSNDYMQHRARLLAGTR